MTPSKKGGGSGESLSSESFEGNDLIGSLTKYLVCTGLPDHSYLALLSCNVLRVWERD